MLSDTDLAIAAITAVSGFIVLFCCVGFCYWRDSERRSRWNVDNHDAGRRPSLAPGELPPPSLQPRGLAAALQAAQGIPSSEPGAPPMVIPLLPTGYQAPSKRLNASKWRQQGNNAQSKFSKVTSLVDIISDDSAMRAYGALSAAQEEGAATPRSARTPRSSRSKESDTDPSKKQERGGQSGGKSSRSNSRGGLQMGGSSSSSAVPGGGSKSAAASSSSSKLGAGTATAPRRDVELGDIENNGCRTRDSKMSAAAQAALAGGKSGGKRPVRAGCESPLAKVRPPPLLDIDDAPLQPTMLGRQVEGTPSDAPSAVRQKSKQLEVNAQAFPVPGLPPPPRSPMPVQSPQNQFKISTTKSTTSLPAPTLVPPPPQCSSPEESPRDGAQAEWRGHHVQNKEAPPPKPPSSLPPPAEQVFKLSTGGDLLDQIELPSIAPPPVRSTSPSPAKVQQPRKKRPSRSPARRSELEDESRSASGSEDSGRRGGLPRPRRSLTPDVSRRGDKFDALDAELAAEIEAEVESAVAFSFDSTALQRTPGGLPFPPKPGSNAAPDKGAKRKSSPNGRQKTNKPRAVAGRDA